MTDSATRLDLRQLKIQAKELLRAVQAQETTALARAVAYFPKSANFTLANAQLVIARESGRDSWARLKREIETTPIEAPRSTTSQLFGAIDAGDEELAISLLAQEPGLAGASQAKQHGWRTPLYAAARNGRLSVAKRLVELGAEIYAVGQGGYPPVYEAVHAGHQELAEFLMDASGKSDGGLPPTYGCGIDIVLATRLGLVDRIKMHIDRDPFAVYRRGCIGESVLHWPAHNGQVEVVQILIEAGAQIQADEIGLYGGKPLHWASEHAPKTQALLLKHGADPNCRNLMNNEFEGYTPLHMMARQREQELECARQLLDAGADPQLLDARGQTPLDVANLNGRIETATFLASL